MLLRSLLKQIQLSCVVIVISIYGPGCGKENSNNPSTGKNTSKSPVKTTYNSAEFCAYYDANDNIKSMSNHPKKAIDMKETAFLLGDVKLKHKTPDQVAKVIGMVFQNIKMGSLKSGNRICFYKGTEKSLKKIAPNINIEHFIWIGHGINGNLKSPKGKTINPKNIPEFLSNELDLVVLNSCQAGKKKEEWERIFKHTPRNNIVSSSDDIPVADSLIRLATDIAERIKNDRDHI